MADRRTRRQKLEAMARQTVSPHEAEIARQKLQESTVVSDLNPYLYLWGDDIPIVTADDIFRARRNATAYPGTLSAEDIFRARRMMGLDVD